MIRKLIGLLCVCMLLSGCGSGSSESLEPESSVIETTAAASPIPLLEQGIVQEEGNNLRYIPNSTVEDMVSAGASAIAYTMEELYQLLST